MRNAMMNSWQATKSRKRKKPRKCNWQDTVEAIRAMEAYKAGNREHKVKQVKCLLASWGYQWDQWDPFDEQLLIDISKGLPYAKGVWKPTVRRLIAREFLRAKAEAGMSRAERRRGEYIPARCPKGRKIELPVGYERVSVPMKERANAERLPRNRPQSMESYAASVRAGAALAKAKYESRQRLVERGWVD